MRFEWLPTALAAVAFVGFAAAFLSELVTYQRLAVVWANGDIASRAHLAASNLEEPLRTQDFRTIRRIGEACEADGVHLLVTSARGGVFYSSRSRDSRDVPLYSERCPSGEYLVSIGLPRDRVMAPFRKALRGFLSAGLVGIAGVLLFFFVTYRQRVRIRELKRVERFRREFVADVSHEIKTPLTGILGAVDLLADAKDGGTGREQGVLVGLIRKESKRLNGLVQSILDLARLEREGDVLVRSEVSLADLVREAVSSHLPAAGEAGVSLAVEVSRDAEVRADAQLVAQAVSNLVANAIRHSGSKDIRVVVGSEGGSARIVVEDRGVGIPPEEAERVFERFHRLDPARAAETGGAGLGLAIVRRIARLHGGDVTLDAVRPHGCRFTFSLPMRAV